MHRLDSYVETVLIPEYTRGRLRRSNPAYRKVERALARARERGDRATAPAMRKRLRDLPSRDPYDPGFRRLRYVRYADDQLLGFIGPKAEAEQIKARLTAFLRDDLKLELSATKTLITHARTGAATFLGYEITAQHGGNARRSANGKIALRVPRTVITAKCAHYTQHGKPARRTRLTNADDYTIASVYGAEYRGFVQYYLPASNVFRLNRLQWVMQTSMLKTLAAKHGSTVSKMAARYKAKIDTPHGLRTCSEATVERQGRESLVARFGGIPLKRNRRAVLTDRDCQPAPFRYRELIHRLLRGVCEICKGTDDIQVHHVRKLADLTAPAKADTPAWMKTMARMRRKSLIVCGCCHDFTHAG